MTSQRTVYRDILAGAVESMRTDYDDLREAIHPSDTLHEIADGHVPIYSYELLELAADEPRFALDEPECGPAFDGTPTPVNIIAANVYEALSNDLHMAFDEWRDEDEA